MNLFVLAQEDGNNLAEIVGVVVQLGLLLGVMVGMWKTFEKAGKPGWAAIVPIYNAAVLLQVAGKPSWWLFLLFIPLVNLMGSVTQVMFCMCVTGSWV